MASFNLTTQFKVNEDICVQKYVSSDTGLTIVLAQMKGPVLHAYFVIPTEPRNDEGDAHAVEHMIYGGSEDYPYKGVIDILTNRYLSHGCSAETNKDYTCYKLDIACSRGLNLLLPVYLDHILYPLLNEFTFTTEVYHINGEGKEGGVLHTKLLSRENLCDPSALLEACKYLYPNTGYSYDAQGLPDASRELDIEKIREYHAMYYHPDNLTIFIAGQTSPDEIFEAIAPIEQKILEKDPRPPFELHWNPSAEPLVDNVVHQLSYPTDEEIDGTVYITWKGPYSIRQYNELIECATLLKYLCSGPVSPLKSALAEHNLGTDVDFQILELYEALMVVKVSGVNLEQMSEVEEKLLASIQQISEENSLNMDRLKIVIQTFRETELNRLEEEPHCSVFQKLLPVIVHSQDEDENTLEARFNLEELTENLVSKTAEDWIEILNTYFVENKHVTIEAIPSIVEQQIVTEREQGRLEVLQESVDLETMQEQLESSIANNETSPPDELITDAELLTNAELNYHWALRYCSSKQISPPGIKLHKMPVYTEAYDLSTSFVYMSAIFGTDSVPSDLRIYLPLFVQLLTNSPIETEDGLISLEELSTTLEEDLVSVKVSVGLQGSLNLVYFNHFMLSIQVEIEKYEKGVQWLHNILYRTIFEPERIKICAQKLLNHVTELRRDGQIVGQQILNALIYEKTSNICLHSLIKQRNFLNFVVTQVNNPDLCVLVVEPLDTLRQMMMTSLDTISLHIATDWSKLHSLDIDLNTPWTPVFPVKEDLCFKRLYTLPDYVFAGDSSEISGIIVGRVSAKTSCLFQAVPCINSYRDLDLPAITVFLRYINQPEGVIWKTLKGKALAYGYSIKVYPSEGLMRLSITQSNNITSAYKELRALIEHQLQGEWNESLVDSAKSACIFSAVNTESTISKLVHQSIRTSFNDVPYDQNKVFIKKLQKVTLEQLDCVGQKYVARLFDDGIKTCCICPATKVDAIMEGFESLGINLLNQHSVDESILAHI